MRLPHHHLLPTLLLVLSPLASTLPASSLSSTTSSSTPSPIPPFTLTPSFWFSLYNQKLSSRSYTPTYRLTNSQITGGRHPLSPLPVTSPSLLTQFEIASIDLFRGELLLRSQTNLWNLAAVPRWFGQQTATGWKPDAKEMPKSVPWPPVMDMWEADMLAKENGRGGAYTEVRYQMLRFPGRVSGNVVWAPCYLFLGNVGEPWVVRLDTKTVVNPPWGVGIAGLGLEMGSANGSLIAVA